MRQSGRVVNQFFVFLRADPQSLLFSGNAPPGDQFGVPKSSARDDPVTIDLPRARVYVDFKSQRLRPRRSRSRSQDDRQILHGRADNLSERSSKPQMDTDEHRLKVDLDRDICVDLCASVVKSGARVMNAQNARSRCGCDRSPAGLPIGIYTSPKLPSA